MSPPARLSVVGAHYEYNWILYLQKGPAGQRSGWSLRFRYSLPAHWLRMSLPQVAVGAMTLADSRARRVTKKVKS